MDHNMDSIGEAVTYKIRESITNKLIELEVPFEKELPDYIMVMVANRKTRSQMEEDLFLFLGDGTTEFMDWFENTMKKFQSSSVKQLDEVSLPDAKESKASNLYEGSKGVFECSSIPKAFSSYSESDVLTLEIPEHDADFLGEELDDIFKSSVISHNSSLIDKTLPGKWSVDAFQMSMENKLKELPASEKRGLAIPENSFSFQQKRIVPCSAVVPVKRFKSTLEVESEPGEQQFGSVASIIRVTERKSSVPVALQANKLLLLKAVDAANKSIMAHKKPVKCSKSMHESSVALKSDLPPGKDARIAVLDEKKQPPNVVTAARKPLGNNDSLYLPAGSLHQGLICPSVIPESTNVLSDTEVVHDASNHSFTGDAPVIGTNNSAVCHSGKIDKACSTEETVQCHSTVSPRFVVTLDGIDHRTLKRKRKCCDVEREADSNQTCYPRAVMDSDCKDFVPLEKCVPLTEKKLKINEKCRYWPACKSGDLCNYHHPTTTCKAFPNCTFGDKCLFIHPNCKFDALCTKKGCPYTHASKRKITVTEVLSPKKSHLSTVIPCKYFPNCVSENCTFFHPRTCWYGSQCKYLGCPYSHSLPVRNQLKWCAQ